MIACGGYAQSEFVESISNIWILGCRFVWRVKWMVSECWCDWKLWTKNKLSEVKVFCKTADYKVTVWCNMVSSCEKAWMQQKIWRHLVRNCTIWFTPNTKRMLGNSQVRWTAWHVVLFNFDIMNWNQSSQARVCIPGMLLELPGPVLSQMVQDKATLTAGVEKALGALQLAKEPRYSNGDGVAKPDLLPPSCSLVLVCGFSKSSFLSQMNSQQRSEVVFRCRRTKSFKSEEMSLCGSVCPWRQHQLCIILVTRNTW